MKKTFKSILLFFITAMLFTANAQTANIVVYAKHSVHPVSKAKLAEYKFEINNLSSYSIQQLDIGCYNPDKAKTQAQFAYEWKPFGNGNFGIDKSAQQTITILPTGWQIEVQEVHGEADYCLEIRTATDDSPYGIPAVKSTKNTGQDFVFRLKKLDPNYVNAYVKSLVSG